MPTILPPSPSASLAPSGTLTPSSTTYYLDAPAGTLPLTGSTLESEARTYIDMPIGHIGGTIVLGGGGIVKVGGTSINQQPERKQPKPRVYPQQAPPRLIHIEYQLAHDAPSGTISLSGTLSEELVESLEYTTPRNIGDPTIQDVLNAQRQARRLTRIREKAGHP